jgi:hypothetical protein
MGLDQRKKSIDEFLTFEIADLAKRHVTAEVIVAIRVTAGTSEGTFAGDLDRQGRTITAKDSSPCGDNAFHLPDYNKGYWQKWNARVVDDQESRMIIVRGLSAEPEAHP